MSDQLTRRVSVEHELWPALRDYWHPVAAAASVQDSPVPCLLLGERLVLFRLEGKVVCFRDLCIHRGTPLSLGWVEGDVVVCAYHGWRYNAEGACVRIPAISLERSIPRKARVDRFDAEERYGLIWVCLGTPRSDIPEFPEYDSPDNVHRLIGPLTWQCSAARSIENFVDQAHFPWVHEGILGDREHPETPAFDVIRDGEELRYSWEDLPNSLHPYPHKRVYRLTRPFAIHQQKRTEEAAQETLFFTSSPNTARTSTNFLYHAFPSSIDDEELERQLELSLQVMLQDQQVVENQRPEELPVDLAAELHIKGPDAVAVQYRRFMAELGVDVDELGSPATEV